MKFAALFSAALFTECKVPRKKFYLQISKTQVVFFTAKERDSIFSGGLSSLGAPVQKILGAPVTGFYIFAFR